MTYDVINKFHNKKVGEVDQAGKEKLETSELGKNKFIFFEKSLANAPSAAKKADKK